MTVSSSSKLKQKLSLLERRKRYCLYRSLWRSVFVGGCAIGLIFIFSLPYWQIQQKSQIQIEGATLVSKNTIFSKLGLTKPEYIWNISNHELVKKLETMSSLEAAKINKQIFPPRLIVLVKERQPVALALSKGKVAFLDRQGVWIPLTLYDRADRNFTLPKLKVVNFQPEYRDTWLELYRLITLYPIIKIEEIRWDESANLFLKTAIGTVYLGGNLSNLSNQFKTLARLKNLPNYFEISNIAYIDLSNPDFELIQKYHP
jgi:cell division protein FtsQ